MLASTQAHVKLWVNSPPCFPLASHPLWQHSWEVEAACRNKLPKLDSSVLFQVISSSSKSISTCAMWGKYSWQQLWRWNYSNTLPLPTYFHLESSQFGSVCVLHCKRSYGHHRGKLDTRHFLQLVNTSLGFVRRVNWRLMPVTCSGTAVKCAAF